MLKAVGLSQPPFSFAMAASGEAAGHRSSSGRTGDWDSSGTCPSSCRRHRHRRHLGCLGHAGAALRPCLKSAPPPPPPPPSPKVFCFRWLAAAVSIIIAFALLELVGAGRRPGLLILLLFLATATVTAALTVVALALLELIEATWRAKGS